MSGSQSSFPLFNGDIGQLEKRLWDSADQLRANSNLGASQYSNPVLGLIFLRYADHRFSVAQKELEGTVDEIEEQGVSLDPGRYAGVAAKVEEELHLKDTSIISLAQRVPELTTASSPEDLETHNRLLHSSGKVEEDEKASEDPQVDLKSSWCRRLFEG